MSYGLILTQPSYIGGAAQPGVTLQHTLMNHSMTVASIAHQLNESHLLAPYGLPFILGETNSLYNEGAPGLSNSFGAALWGVDFNLWCASQNISQVYMHQGTDYRYAAWQPIETNKTRKGTKPPYYGNIAIAAVIGNLASHDVTIANLPMISSMNSAYAAYVDGELSRIAVINMFQYNYTITSRIQRPIVRYHFRVAEHCAGRVGIQRLMANGSDAISGITFDGYSYNYELDNGAPVLLHNITRGEYTYVSRQGVLTVDVPDSSAAILNLRCGKYT